MPYRLSGLAEQDLEEIWPFVADAVRSFVVESYVIYYRHHQGLLIARVLHGRRDQSAAWTE